MKHTDYTYTNKLVVAIPSNVSAISTYISRLTGASSIKSVNLIDKPTVIGTNVTNRKYYSVEYTGKPPHDYKSTMTPGEIYNSQIPHTTQFMLENGFCIGSDMNERQQPDITKLSEWVASWSIAFVRKSSTGIHVLLDDSCTTLHTQQQLATFINKSNCIMVVHTDADSKNDYSYIPEQHRQISIDLKQVLISWHGDMLMKKPVIDRVLYNQIFHPSTNVKNGDHILYREDTRDNFALLAASRDILRKDLMAIVLVLNTTRCGQLEDMNRPNILYLAQKMLSGACHSMNILIQTPVNTHEAQKEKGVGAHVKSATKGVHGKVYDMDMRAMYPSAIMDMEYDPNDVYIRVLREGYIKPLYDLRMQLLDKIEKCTDHSQKQVLDTHQNICKLLMNKMTGLLNCNNRFIKADPKIYNAMTAFGRDTLKNAIKFVTDKGYKVIFADTDGLMVRAIAKKGKKKRKIDHEERLAEIAEEFNEQINPDGTKYSRLVYKGTCDRLFIYGDKSYDAVKNGVFTCKGAFDYASTDIEKYIYKTILTYVVFRDNQLAPEADTEWKKEIRSIIRCSKGDTITERVEGILMSIVTYLNEYVFEDITPWTTVIKLRPDPTKKKDYEFVPVIILSSYTDAKNYEYLLWDNSLFQECVLRSRLGSGVGSFEICKQTRSNMLTKKTSKWISALEQK